MKQSKQCSQTGDRHKILTKILTMTWLSNAGLPSFFSFLVPPSDPFSFLACPPWILLIEEWLVFLLLLHHSSTTSLCSSQICYNGFCRISKWLYRYIADAYSVVLHTSAEFTCSTSSISCILSTISLPSNSPPKAVPILSADNCQLCDTPKLNLHPLTDILGTGSTFCPFCKHCLKCWEWGL